MARRRRGSSTACSIAWRASSGRRNWPHLMARPDPTPPPGEFDLIARYFRPLVAGREGALGLADDAALIDVPAGERLVVTADALVAGIHFLPDDPPDRIARKMLRSNLSD